MLAYLLIICVAFYVVTNSLIGMVGEYLFAQKIREEQYIAEDLAEAVSGALYAGDAQRLYDEVCQSSAQVEGRVLVLDAYAVVQADPYSELNGTRLARSEVAGALSGQGSSYGYYSATGSGSFGASTAGGMIGLYASPITHGGEIIGALVFTTLLQDMYDSLLEVQTRMMMWLMAVACAVALLSLFVSSYFTRPIASFSEGIELMSKGDFSARVNVRGKSEFAQLAKAFNMMCQRLEQLDKSRSQFVSNASHELKTPLSTMKILIETLIYQEDYDAVMQREFLSDVDKEIDRLSSIIGDLLTLVSMDSGEAELTKVPLALGDVMGDTVKRLLPLARERGIELEIALRDPATVAGDAGQLSQVFYNIIDNALKYTQRGGKVRVDLTRAGKKAVAKVADNGMGIPKADIMNVFDRFYRVDKARSRETGGTGLGLSIVKQIVMNHGGVVYVTSEEGKGSTFTVELPLAQ